MAALVTAFAYDNHSTVGPSTPRAADGSVFDQPVSDCGENEVVFARAVDRGDHSAHLDLPAGVYYSQLIAEGDIELGPIREPTTYSPNPATSRPFTRVRSWNNWKGESLLMDRVVGRVSGESITSWSAHLRTPGGIAQFSVAFFGYPSDLDEWHRSPRWRWMIIKPGVCEVPDEGFDSGWPAGSLDLTALETR
ncbi:MAG: hypothetical protein F4X58_02305 [Chloroflexi bacterium]|nr:hypothetical protein [Chloroflexota bacterium]MYC00737.1 hypothetical protein [Chloroflexota bacterium]